IRLSDPTGLIAYGDESPANAGVCPSIQARMLYSQCGGGWENYKRRVRGSTFNALEADDRRQAAAVANDWYYTTCALGGIETCWEVAHTGRYADDPVEALGITMAYDQLWLEILNK